MRARTYTFIFVLELTVLQCKLHKRKCSMFKIGKNLLHFVCGFCLVAHKHTTENRFTHSVLFYLHSKRTCGIVHVHGSIDFNIEREQLDTTRARAHQYWHVIAQLCTEMGIKKHIYRNGSNRNRCKIEVSSERNEMK